jgi:hypothetical protein
MNMATHQTFTLWSGDTVKVTDSNGFTALFQWIPTVNPPWIYKAGSLRDKSGNPVDDGTAAPKPTTGGSPQPTSPVTITLPGGPSLTVLPFYNNPTPTGVITVSPIDDPSPALDIAGGD